MKPFENETSSIKRRPYSAAILASSSLESDSYRKNFDVSIPLYNPLTATIEFNSKLG